MLKWEEWRNNIDGDDGRDRGSGGDSNFESKKNDFEESRLKIWGETRTEGEESEKKAFDKEGEIAW